MLNVKTKRGTVLEVYGIVEDTSTGHVTGLLAYKKEGNRKCGVPCEVAIEDIDGRVDIDLTEDLPQPTTGTGKVVPRIREKVVSYWECGCGMVYKDNVKRCRKCGDVQ